MIDIRQTSQYAKYLRQVGWETERAAEINYFIKKIPLIGSVIKIQRPEVIKIKKVNKLAKKNRAFQIIIEPKTKIDAKYLKSVGFKKSKKPYLPTKTLYLNLTKNKKALFKNLKRDARRSIKKTKGVKLRTPKVKTFRNYWKKAVGLRRYVPPEKNLKALRKSFKKNSLLLSTKDGSAGAIFLKTKNIGYYWQSFTNKKGRKELSQYRIVWEGVLWAKKEGVKVFDFEGIYDRRFPQESWTGFSHFKRKFGGDDKNYPGTFVKTRFPLKIKGVNSNHLSPGQPDKEEKTRMSCKIYDPSI